MLFLFVYRMCNIFVWVRTKYCFTDQISFNSKILFLRLLLFFSSFTCLSSNFHLFLLFSLSYGFVFIFFLYVEWMTVRQVSTTYTHINTIGELFEGNLHWICKNIHNSQTVHACVLENFRIFRNTVLPDYVDALQVVPIAYTFILVRYMDS